MSEPHTPQSIAHALRQMPADRLAVAVPRDFYIWPVRKIVPPDVVRELISNEIAARRTKHG